MKKNAISLVLIMVAGSLAGCIAGDNDGVPEISLSDEDITGLFDDYFMDFVNNSSVTVINEIHYHNNTTVTHNQYDQSNNFHNNTTNEGEEVSNDYENNHYTNYSYTGSSTGSLGPNYFVDFEFRVSDLLGIHSDNETIDHYNNTYQVENYSYYDYLQNTVLTETFLIPCSIYYIVGSGNNSSENWNITVSYWDDSSWYENAWDDMGFNTTMRQLFHDYAWEDSLRVVCDYNFVNYETEPTYYTGVIYSFNLPEGMSLQCKNGPPKLFYGGNSTWTEYYHGVSIRIDGMSAPCSYGLGGSQDMVIEIMSYQLYMDYNFRLAWSFQMEPVIPLSNN